MNADVVRVSFKDPDGFVFSYNSKIYRAVLISYKDDLEKLTNLDILQSPQLIKHTAIAITFFPDDVISWLHTQIGFEELLTIFALDKIQYISYPWEWTPTMLKEAAEFTLNFQYHLLEKGLTLKDASFFNIQFIKGKPVFIDLLSIKRADKDVYPWFAYGQFLQHFIFPLIILKYKRFDSLQFLQAYPNGISKVEVIKHISLKSYFSIFELFHIHIFKYVNQESKKNVGNTTLPQDTQIKYVKQLLSFAAKYVKNVYKDRHQNTQWINYYEENTLSDYTAKKEKVFIEFINRLNKIETAVDLGANTGHYSQILIKHVQQLLSVEQDSICCEIINRNIKASALEKQWQVICSDLLHPSPAIGWLNSERKSLIERMRSDLIVALAIVHHIYFSGSIDFVQIAELFNKISARYVVVEFVNSNDDKVLLLSQKNDTRLQFYTEELFIKAMRLYFTCEDIQAVSLTRNLLLFKKTG